MNHSTRVRTCLGLLATVGCGAWLFAGAVSCGGTSTAVLVRPVAIVGNEPPQLTFTEPIANVTVGKGENFLIQWTDSDRDSNAQISFWLFVDGTDPSIVQSVVQGFLAPVPPDQILLVSNLDENDASGADRFTVNTSLLSLGDYNLVGVIDDGVNPIDPVLAPVANSATNASVLIKIVEPGTGPVTVPPIITVTAPLFNQSVAQDDVLIISVQPSELGVDAATPFDPDSDITLYVLLDVDQDPNNDDPANPSADGSDIIVLEKRTVPVQSFAAIPFAITIDLATIPPRPNGDPYFVRATVDDATNPRVHRYATGQISVVELASGTVDLFDVGRTKSGASFYGFNPGAQVGSTIAGVSDFDRSDPTDASTGDPATDTDDFVIVARFGNPRNFGLLGEAYLIYGRDGVRFGGSLPVNTVSSVISGVIFEAPPIRTARISSSGARSDGITDVSFVRDLSFPRDGRPELLFGLPHVHGAIEAMDFDPGDQDVAGGDNTQDIEIVLRQGEAQTTIGDLPPTSDLSYSGVDDTTIDSSNANQSMGSDGALRLRDTGAGQRQYMLLKFRNVLNNIPTAISDVDVDSIAATVQLRIFNTGGDGAVFQSLTDFTEQTTYSSYAVNGGDPQAGVDYLVGGAGTGGLGSLDGGSAAATTFDVSDLVRQLFDGELSVFNNELRFIIIPSAADGADDTAVRSSEFTFDGDRPTLTIRYTQTNAFGALGCYPDLLVNNRSDDAQDDPFDWQFYGGGMAILVDSRNRDTEPRLGDPPVRLDTTAVSLELVGQESGIILGAGGVDQTGGGIFARADDYNEEGHIAGARFVAGPYDDEDHLSLRQPPREGLFGQSVGSVGDLNNDGLDEIIISAPRNERYIQDLLDAFGFASTHFQSTMFRGSITVIPGADYNDTFWRENSSAQESNSSIPMLDQQTHPPFGNCNPGEPRHLDRPLDSFQIFAEHIDDFLGDGQSAGDFNQDGIDDILCGAPGNDRSASLVDTGATYVLYGRTVLSDFDLGKADDAFNRPPMLRIRGVKPGDKIGWRQATGLDVNGDRVDDVFISSPAADFGLVTRGSCDGDFDGDGDVDGNDIASFNSCEGLQGAEVFSDDACKFFDYNNDGMLDDEDDVVVDCLAGGGTTCCDYLVDNGFVGIVFGGVFTDGDRTIDQLATSDLRGVVFYGASAGHRAGHDVSSAGDFNQDGFGDILIAAPGETRLDSAGRARLGVVYLVFGGPHLENTVWSLDQVGSEDLPGIVFVSPFVKGRPNEAAPTEVSFLGDINNDGFGDIGIGIPLADFIDLSFPQGPDATDASTGRRRNAGTAYVIYGNNFGTNR